MEYLQKWQNDLLEELHKELSLENKNPQVIQSLLNQIKHSIYLMNNAKPLAPTLKESGL